jgi:hypothetical protein
MKPGAINTLILFLLLPVAAYSIIGGGSAQKTIGSANRPIPKIWDDEALASLDVPLADAGVKLKHADASFYYQIPVRAILKTYAVYAPGKEPQGYIEGLKQQNPEVVFDAGKLETDEDWIKAGELIFDAPITRNEAGTLDDVRDPAWYQKHSIPVAKDGTVPFLRYTIRRKGLVEVGAFSCAMCHTRVMPDRSVIKGAQGNFPLDRVLASSFRTRLKPEMVRLVSKQLFATPWLKNDPHARLGDMPVEQILAAQEAIPPGVMTRFGTSIFFPPQVPDLIGIKDRRYLDHTGLVRHRAIEDLMRYSAINQGGDILDRFGDFVPIGATPESRFLVRYSDEQLYALALYLYSLKPPPNPNKFDGLAARGKKVFEREGCAQCHTPPLYTNNKLTPAEGFKVPDEHRKLFDILPFSVGTDPNLAMSTRRGTGYYKVPSLKGVWYRGPFEHNGSVATLEDWFDARRLSPDYVPTGFRGAEVKSRAVKGHQFGLNLSEKDRTALIAFLKTL